MKHTEEPWEWYTTNYTIVGTRPDYGEDWERAALAVMSGYKDVAEANARRIVACVNACKGISTEDLEQAGTDWIMVHTENST